MTTQNAQTPSVLNGTGNMTIQQLYDAGLNLIQGICTIVTLPVEYVLRPQFGTRYFNPAATFFACIMMFLLGGFGASGIGRALPPTAHHGIVGLTVLAGLFFLGNLIHGPRVYWRMLHPERELHSEYEGPALFFLSPLFALLPYGKRPWPVRIVYEPLTVLLATAILWALGVLDAPAALYLVTAAVFLSVKCSLEWYRWWLYIRILLDSQAAAPVIASIVRGTATDEDMAKVHIASFPKGVSPQIKAAVIAQRTGMLPSALAGLLSPVQAPGAPAVA